jgi:hypothetical protein
VSGNGVQGIEDAIIALQIISNRTGLFMSPCFAADADVSGDGAVGMEEAMYILQRLAGLRTQ